MLRAMFSGVSGMKAHQVKMDVIGNNIANVNTYGFKASRTNFSDVYYQSTKTATAPTTYSGGMNGIQVGYGSTVSSVDVLQKRGGFQMTDSNMDLAIAGEGFFQVQDPDGNIFYTRAGQMKVDADGNLVDNNGYYVLGVSGNPLGKSPDSEKVKINVPAVNPSRAEVKEKINGSEFSITNSENNKYGNLTFNFTSSDEMPLGQKCKAEITTTGISVILNAQETIDNMAELQSLVNSAITNANGGKQHPAGIFSIDMEGAAEKFAGGGLTGLEIVSTQYTPNFGKMEITDPLVGKDQTYVFGGVSLANKDSVGPNFSGTGAGTVAVAAVGTAPNVTGYTLTVTENGKTWSNTVPASAMKSGTIKLSRTDIGGPGADSPGDYMILNHPGFGKLETYVNGVTGGTGGANDRLSYAINLTPTEASKAIGLGTKPLQLVGGTEGGAQTVGDLSSYGISSTGVFEANHPTHKKMELGRIDIVTFENAQGLEQVGNGYFRATGNSGSVTRSVAGTNGAGELQGGALEMSNSDLSNEFSEMITTQRGFQACSRMITVADEMLDELVNLKR